MPISQGSGPGPVNLLQGSVRKATRQNLNFIGATVTDNPGTNSADIVISGNFDATKIQLITGSDATGAGELIGTYATIQAALNAIPNGTNSTDVRKVYIVLIPPGTYDEDLTVDITRCHVQLCALGAVNIGLFNNTFWAASNTRNITIVNTATNVDSIRSSFGMDTYINSATSSTTHPAYSTGFRLSGSVIFGTMPVGFTDIELYLAGEIFGDIDSSAFATHNFHLYLNKARIRGQVKGARNLLQMADDCTFTGLVTCNEYAVVRDSSFEGGMTVSNASTAGFQPWGLFACNFAGTFTGPANSMHLDSTTNYYFVLNGAALAGGATQVILENGAGGGISQLTGDVTAGPGSGSQAATIAAIQGTTVAGVTGTSKVVFSNSPTFSGTAIMPAMLGSTAAVSSAGGNVTWGGAPGDATGSGGGGGNATISGGAANGDNSQNKAGGNVVLNGGASKGSSSGGNISGTAGTGGPGTGSAGATGGNMSWQAGAGGVGSATSANGGIASLTGGTAGAGTVPGNGGAANVTGGAAASVAGSAGGNVTIASGAGTSTGTGGAAGSLTITGANANGDGTVDRAGASVTVNGGSSKGSAAGGGFTVNCGVGGGGTGSAGATGGTGNYNGGTGGVGSATSGNGGGFTGKGGTGGAGTAGGNGGTAQLVGGTAGTGSASAGNGGPANVSGGSAGSFAGSAGGNVSLVAAGGSSTGSGGNGGTAVVTGANAGGDNSADRNGGSVTITSGTSKGSANGAAININLGAGGLGTGSVGATGGAFTVSGGSGGAGSATGGGGGGLNFNAGVGGNSTAPGAGGEIIFKTAATTSLTEHFRIKNNGECVVTAGNLEIATAGNGLQIKGGSNCKVGTATLVAGTATVSNTTVTANSRIFVTSNTDGGTPGWLRVSAKVNSTSFTITSSSATDTSTVAWMIVESL